MSEMGITEPAVSRREAAAVTDAAKGLYAFAAVSFLSVGTLPSGRCLSPR